MTAPAVLVMDLGGVTCRWLPDRRLDALSALSGLPPATIDLQVFESGFDDAGERGRIGLEEFTRTLTSMLGLEVGSHTDRALRHAWSQAFEPDPEVLRLIGEAGARRALFTNNGPLLEAAMEAEGCEVRTFEADALCIACEGGPTCLTRPVLRVA